MPGMEKGDMMNLDTTNKNIWEAINSLKYSAKISESAGRADQMFYKSLQEGLESNDLDKIYEFIDACERGRGLRTDATVRKLFQKAYKADPEHLCRILAEKNDIIYYWMFLSTSCDPSMILSFTKMDLPYPAFYYECARILLRQMREETPYEEGIISAVKKIADSDLALWKRWVHKFEYNKHWQKLVFRTLEQLSRDALKIYAQTICLDMQTQHDALGILSQEFGRLPNSSKDYILENISNIIWERWCLLIEQKKKNFVFLNKIMITGYTNLILNGFLYTLNSKEEWKSCFLNYAEILNQNMSAWYETQTKMSNIFFYDITQLYYILLVGQEFQMPENEGSIYHCAQIIQTFILQYEYFWIENDSQKAKFLNLLENVSA
jgi:hypothetical protein